MTQLEYSREREYRINERLGILVADGKPSIQQIAAARAEAEQAMDLLERAERESN